MISLLKSGWVKFVLKQLILLMRYLADFLSIQIWHKVIL